jgi:hypothetical protein
MLFIASELTQAVPATRSPALPWIEVGQNAPYFMTDRGEPWTPIGQNDAISWIELDGLFRRRNLEAVEKHLTWLVGHGVTCLRLMLEYAQVRHRYIERPAGSFPLNMVRLWDDLFLLCERTGLRILLTPFDTFWTWRHWRWHPYNVKNGGSLDHPSRILLCRSTREAIKRRLTFAVERWSGSGALFAWDLFNEIHPAQAEGSAEPFMEFIHDLSRHVRTLELRLYGRSHPQTVSLFGPELWWRPNMPLKEPIFRHPDLDFATIHIYREGTIDDPLNTVDPAIDTGRIVRDALAEISDHRPFLDTEHGPIYRFKDKDTTLPEYFDDEYFRHMQWAHFASGAAGGGMRWPNRRPHVLTPGMRRAQKALASFLPLIDWRRFRRININDEIEAPDCVARFGCSDQNQAVVWLLRKDTINPDGTVRRNVRPISVRLRVPGPRGKRFRVTAWDTYSGAVVARFDMQSSGDGLAIETPAFVSDIALAVAAL